MGEDRSADGVDALLGIYFAVIKLLELIEGAGSEMNAPVVQFEAVAAVVGRPMLSKEASGARLMGVALRELS